MAFPSIEIHNPSNESNKGKNFTKMEVICFHFPFLYLQLVGEESSVYPCVVNYTSGNEFERKSPSLSRKVSLTTFYVHLYPSFTLDSSLNKHCSQPRMSKSSISHNCLISPTRKKPVPFLFLVALYCF